MKTLFTLSLITLLVGSTSFTAVVPGPAPGTFTSIRTTAGGFDFFRTHRQGRAGITATWGYTGTAGSVTGFVVERTYDDPTDPYASWDIVGAIPFTGAKSYRSTENGIFPGFLSYRVTALLPGGGTVQSPVSTEHIISH